MSTACAHPSWVRRPDEDKGLLCRFRCSHCHAPARRRFDEPDSAIRPYTDPAKTDAPSPADYRIESRMRADRTRGGAHLSLVVCNGNAAHQARGGAL